MDHSFIHLLICLFPLGVTGCLQTLVAECGGLIKNVDEINICVEFPFYNMALFFLIPIRTDSCCNRKTFKRQKKRKVKLLKQKRRFQGGEEDGELLP